MRTYSWNIARKAQAILAVGIFIFPALALGQGLKLDLLDGTDCRLFCDSTQKGLCVTRDSAAFLTSPSILRYSNKIDDDNQLLSSQPYYLSENDLNRNGHYRVYALSEAAVNRSQLREGSDWEAAKKSTLGKSGLAGQPGKGLFNIDIPVKFPKLITSLVGEGGPGLSVTGDYKVLFKLDKTSISNRANIGVNNQNTPGFQTQQEYNMYITGNVGSKLFVNMKTDKRANVYNQRLDLADRIQIRYKGNDEDLVQSIEAGNTSLALGGTRFAGFSQSVQGLFGLKAQGKLGGVTWTAITSQQKGNSESKTFRAGTDANRYTIRDKDYVRYLKFDLGRKVEAKPDSGNGLPAFQNDFQPGDRIVGLDLFQKVPNEPGQAIKRIGTCYVDPLDSSNVAYKAFSAPGYFQHILNLNNVAYIVSPDSFYVRFTNPLLNGDVIGAIMMVQRAGSSRVDTIGGAVTNGVDTTLVLKLIKNSIDNKADPTYYYEWKNIYDVRARDIQPDGLTVNIYKAAISRENDLANKDYQERVPKDGGGSIRYMQLLGLDLRQEGTGLPPPDTKIDMNYVVDRVRGLITFPDRYPFSTNRSFGQPQDTLYVKVPSIYYRDSTVSSEYFLDVTSKARRVDFSLGQVDITEGTEDVRLNGQKLVRNQDYTIDYELGQIHFNNPQVTDPNADVQINYEYTPFLTATKKNLFGLRTEYAPGDNFRVGSTVLYRNSSSIDQKPRIGEEPSRALLMDADFAYTGQSNLITKLVNKLPGVMAVAPSAFQLDGEIARSVPNPNTIGKAYIDDFEGSRDYLNLGILREIWTLSSPPTSRDSSRIVSNRGRLAWFTPDSKIYDPRNANRPIDRFGVLEIFPDRDVPSPNEKTDVLELRYFPKRDSSGAVDPKSWGGIMRYLPTGMQNQVETQFIEFWLGLEEDKPLPRLHFDLGKISEDINADNVLQTEDRNGNRVLDNGEDVGLDGVPDSLEPGYGPNNPDPNGDDWGTDIDHINGTEKNANDPGRLGRPDTEDLSNSGQLEGAGSDSYFDFEVDLSDTARFGVPGSFHYNNNQRVPRSGENRALFWRLYRVPLKDTSFVRKVANPTWNAIQFVRLWVDSVPDTTRMIFASLDLVGNRWKVAGVVGGDSARPVSKDEKVRVSVINSQENPNYRADPPPGVSEVLNRVTNLREREQSLVIGFENLQPGHSGLVKRVLLAGAEDYSGYRTMKMLVHGDPVGALSDSLQFFFRFSSVSETDSNNFYEYRVRLKPGWNPDNNVNIDFDFLTNLKNRMLKNQSAGDSTDTISDGPYFVKGNPSLAAVRWYVMGVKNANSSKTATGEVWTDELLLTDVRRESGTAGRFHISTQLSDFGSLNFEASRVGATFRTLTAGGESGTLSFNRTAATNELLSFSSNFQAHRLLPRFLGITGLPISINWSRNRSTPRLRTGSDIVLTKEFAVSERSEQLARGISVSPTFRRETKNPLWNWTLNRMSGAFSYRYNRNSDPFTRLNENRFYTASLSYDLSPKKTVTFKPLSWLSSVGFLKKLGQSGFSPLPANFGLSGDVSRTQTLTIQNDISQTRVGSYARDFNGHVGAGFRFFSNLTADYGFSTRRDISRPENLVFSTSPSRFKLGLEVAQNQTFRSTYDPNIFRFADTRFNFSSSYDETAVLQGTSSGTRRITANNGYGVNVNLNLTRLLGVPPGLTEHEKRILKEEERIKKEARKKEEAERKKAGGKSLAPASDSAAVADSLARGAGKSAVPQAPDSADSVPAPARFRQYMERMLPAPLPGLGLILPRLGPPPAAAPNSANQFQAAAPAALPLSTRRDSLPPAGADSLSRTAGADSSGKADSSKRSASPPDTSKKTGPPQKMAGGAGGGPSVFVDGWNFVRGLGGRVDPIQFTFNRTKNYSRQALRDRPSLAFRFGLTSQLGAQGTRSASDLDGLSDAYTVGSGVNLGSGVRLGARYGKNIALGTGTIGSTRQEAETFPDLTLTVSGLDQRVGFLKKFLPMGSLSSNYQKQTTQNFEAGSSRPTSISTGESYNPLVAVSATFTRGLSANFGYRKSVQTNKALQFDDYSVNQNTEKGFTFSARYSFIAPRGIRFPLLRGIRLASSMNTNLSVQYTRRISRDGQRGIVLTDNTNLAISPTLTYSFSTQVDGALTIQWNDQKNNLDKRTTKVRSAIFSVDLKF